MHQRGFLWALVLTVLMTIFSPAQAQEKIWVQALTGPALYEQGQARTLVFQATREQAVKGVISRVQLSLHYAGAAVVKSRLCHLLSGTCVDLQGGTLNSAAFAGLVADSAFSLHYQLWSWAGPKYPLHLQSRLQVQYQ